jgi:hypothetical protein
MPRFRHRRSTLRRFLLALAPAAEAAPEILGIEVEHAAHVVERHQGVGGRVEEPFLRLGEEAVPTRAAREEVRLEAVDRILQNGEHQPLFAWTIRLLPQPFEVLIRKDEVLFHVRTTPRTPR